MSKHTDYSISPEEREQFLVHASREYLAGHMTLDEYETWQDRYGCDYVAAARDLARLHLPWWLRWLV